jgi:hypothetical protein
MDALREFLEHVKRSGFAQDNFLGLLHLLIGHRIVKEDGTVLAAGLSWRELSALLKKIRWQKGCVKELGLQPSELPPRDRQRYWYAAILKAGVNSPKAAQAGQKLAEVLRKHGYVVDPKPRNG